MTAVAEPVDTLLVDTVERLLAGTCTPEVIERSEADGWCAPVWDPLAEAGFPWISVPEAAGGSGGSLADALAVLRAVGRHAAPVPVAETALLGGWLAAAAGFELPAGAMSVVPDPAALRVEGGRLVGQASVAWGRHAQSIMALVDGRAIALRPDVVQITPGANVAGEPRDTVVVDVELDALESAPVDIDAEALVARGALSRIVMMAGALEAMSQLSVDYAHARRQFGRPIAGFQAVQQHLVVTAQAAARAAMAADLAGAALARGSAEFEVAAAKLVADEAAVLATRAAHQAHGAMGVTREYPLHQLSRRLWAWRHEYGSAARWRRCLGAQLADGGADGLFPAIAR